MSAALGLAFPIGALANAANASLTLRGTGRIGDKPGVTLWRRRPLPGGGRRPPRRFAAFPSVGSISALTAYWEAIEYVALYGVGVLLAAGVVFEALPRVAGREPATLDRPRSFNRWTVVGVGGALTEPSTGRT